MHKFFVGIALLGLLCVSPALADDSDILGVNVVPNVVILFDTSQSMLDPVPSASYNPLTTYTGPYTSTVVYKNASGQNSLFRATVNDVPNAAARSALAATGYWFGQIGGSWIKLVLGNNLNFQQCTSCVAAGSTPKFTIAKQTITGLISSIDGVRLGVMGFRSQGASMVAPVGTAKNTAINAVNAMATTSVGTPLGDALYDVGQYYQGLYSGQSSPIQYVCQPNFAILMTDGLPLNDSRAPVSNVATALRSTDHTAAFAGLQNVSTNTIGFAVPEGAALLTQTASNGGGRFYQAGNSAELGFALLNTIGHVIAGNFSFTAPVLPSTNVTGDSHAYVASFQSDPARAFWRGFLQAYQRDADGHIPVDGNGLPLASALVWSAGQELSQQAASSRTIFTALDGHNAAFEKNNLNLTAALLNVPDSAARDRLIDFIRGIDAFDEDGDANVTEERAWKLGDIFHAKPVLVSAPAMPLADPTYVAFQQARANRTAVLLVGANDGMLHAFRQSDGVELWAFVPPDLLSKLSKLSSGGGEHPFYVDASPIVADIQISGQWKTIVMFGERRGGQYYHALDITDTTNPQFLWSFTDSKLGETWSEPAIGPVRLADQTTKFAAFVGGGYNTAVNNNTGKAFVVVDLETGQKLWEYFNDGSLDDQRYMNFSLAANPSAADLDHDGFIDRVYIGDVGGQLWKFDLSAPATLSAGRVTNWTGKRLFVADPSQPNPPTAGEYYPAQAMYGTPALSFDATGNLWVLLGTGDLNHPNNTSTNRFYGIKDNTSMTNGSALTEASLVNVTSSDASATQGWFFQLGSAEKVITTADVFNNTVFFSTFTPDATAGCSAVNAAAKLYAVQMLTGYAALNFATSAALTTSNSTLARSKSIGTGIAFKPVISLSESGSMATPSVLTATSDKQLVSTTTPSIPLKRTLSWRDVF